MFGSLTTPLFTATVCLIFSTTLFLCTVESSEMVLVHSAADFSKCVRIAFQGDGALIDLVDCHFCDQLQHVTKADLLSLENGFGYFTFYLATQGLSNNGYSNQDGLALLSWSYLNLQTNQQWRANGKVNSTFQLELNVPSKCATYDDSRGIMVQSTCESSIWQTFIMEQVDNPIKILQSQFSNKQCIRYKDALVGSTELKMVECSTVDISQLLSSISSDDVGSSNGIRFVASDQCLAVSESGDSVLQATCANVETQNWLQVSNLDGSFSLQSSDLCLSFDGTTISLTNCHPTLDEQKWNYNFAVVEPNGILLQQDITGLCYSAGNHGKLHLSQCDPTSQAQIINPIGCGLMADFLSNEAVEVKLGELCLTRNSNSEWDHVTLANCADTVSQQWLIIFTGDGDTFTIAGGNFPDFWCVTAQEKLDYMYLGNCTAADDFQIWSMLVPGAKKRKFIPNSNFKFQFELH